MTLLNIRRFFTHQFPWKLLMKLSSYNKIAQTAWFIYFLIEIYFLTLLEAQAPNASRTASGETSLLELQMVLSQCPYMAFLWVGMQKGQERDIFGVLFHDKATTLIALRPHSSVTTVSLI